MCRLVLSFSSYFFYKGAAHFFGVRYTQHLKPFYLFFRVEERGGGGGGWLQHALASC